MLREASSVDWLSAVGRGVEIKRGVGSQIGGRANVPGRAAGILTSTKVTFAKGCRYQDRHSTLELFLVPPEWMPLLGLAHALAEAGLTLSFP